MSTLTNKHIVLGVTGGIAAYKSAEITRRMQDVGAEVRVVMTKAACEFITPLTMQALSGHPVSRDLLDPAAEAAMGHIELARWADLVLVAPATANYMSKIATGTADDLLSTLSLATIAPIAVAPAMNQAMWLNQATQDNRKLLESRGVHFFGPGDGSQACGDVGPGRLLEPDQIVQLAAAIFESEVLSGVNVLITAGPTREAIDPVRYISNHSSGKQGYALAEAAAAAGGHVTLISGPTSLDAPPRVERISVVSAREMRQAVMSHVSECDLFIGVAAVADYRPANVADRKIKKDGNNETLEVALVENPDILAEVASLTDGPYTVGFAAETNNLEEFAQAKRKRKKVDIIIANDVSDTTIGFNSDDNQTTLVFDGGVKQFGKMSKQQLSRKLVGIFAQNLNLVAKSKSAL